MKKIFKRTAMVVTIIMITTNMTGCVFTGRSKSKQAERLLEEKYSEQFNILNYYGTVFSQGYYEVTAVSQEHPDVLFEAKVYQEDKFVSDEYVTARVCRSIEEQILQNLSALPGNLFVKVQAISKSIDSNNADMTIQEYLTLKSNNRFVIYLHYAPTMRDAEKTYETITNILSGIETMSGTIQLYVVEEEMLEDVQEHLDQLPKIDEAYREILEDIDRISMPFENGKLEMTESEFVREARGRV